MDHVQMQVETSIARINSAEWTRLENGRSLYQSHPWLSWAENNCAADAFYVMARNPTGTLVGAVPAYLLSAADTSWNSWYDPLTVFAGDDAETQDRRSVWFPLLSVGSLSGYHSDVLVDPSLDDADQRAVTRALVLRCRALADARDARSMAMMYAPEGTAVAVSRGGLGATQPILTSANTRISASWNDLDAFLNSFTRRRRYNMQREIDLFRSGGSHIVETRLSDCLQDVGPLLGNVHRKHGAADSDLDTTQYLKSQAAHLNDISRVFLELAHGQSVGFSLCYEWGRELHVRVVGFDYERSARFAYFNLAYYLPLDHAIRRGFSHIHLGPGTYEAKASRGAVLDPTWSLVWPPDDDSRAWFEQVKHPGEDAQEAAPWLRADLKVPGRDS
ncbi:MAG: GNAT family N-acetyltransferase [Gammaproteobacteria bacterium]|nr:GNAT family N-acetyltransferase [Gammaproteobacteria bacterium]